MILQGNIEAEQAEIRKREKEERRKQQEEERKQAEEEEAAAAAAAQVNNILFQEIQCHASTPATVHIALFIERLRDSALAQDLAELFLS